MVYAILVYDVGVERVNKLCSFLRSYLNWVQNSVFEGELSLAQLQEVKSGIRKRVDEKADFVLIFTARSQELVRREVIGVEKNPLSSIV